MKRRLGIVAASCVAVALFLHLTFTFTRARAVEDYAQAAVVRTVGLKPVNAQIVIWGRDDRWREERAAPVSRKLLARVVRAMNAAGAKAIIFDSLNSSPAFDGPEADAAFAAAVRDSGAILATACEDRDRPTTRSLDAWTIPASPLTPRFCAAPLLPFAGLSDGVANGNITVLPSHSLIFRDVTLLAAMPNGGAMPTVSVLALLPKDERVPPKIKAEPDGLRVGSNFVATTPRATRIASGRLPSDVVSLVDLEKALAPEQDVFADKAVAERFKGRFAIYGVTAVEARDYGLVISGDERPLVEVHAALLSDFLEGRDVREVPPTGAFLLALIFALLLAYAGLTLRPIVAVLALGMGLCAWLGLLVSACRGDLLLPPVAPAMSGAAGLGIGMYRRLRQREREQSLLKAAFGDYVDPLLLGMLLGKSSPSLLGLRKEVTVLFVDLVGYTRMTNALPADKSLQILRDYVQRVTTIIKAAGGRIDKIIGDGVMAVFNDPIPLDDHARVAVRVAKEIHAAVKASNLQCRIGIATGDAFVGNIGQPGAKIEYTVIGATVNLASRLEGQASVGGTLISEQTFVLCAGDSDFSEAETISLKGFDEPVRAHRSVTSA